MLPLRLLALILIVLIPSAAMGQQASGWWVVIGSFPAENTAAMVTEVREVSAAAARCGLQSFNDFSSKFRGFRPGFNVFVVGPYRSRADADATATVARRCLPDAYVKYGEYLGE